MCPHPTASSSHLLAACPGSQDISYFLFSVTFQSPVGSSSAVCASYSQPGCRLQVAEGWALCLAHRPALGRWPASGGWDDKADVQKGLKRSCLFRKSQCVRPCPLFLEDFRSYRGPPGTLYRYRQRTGLCRNQAGVFPGGSTAWLCLRPQQP